MGKIEALRVFDWTSGGQDQRRSGERVCPGNGWIRDLDDNDLVVRAQYGGRILIPHEWFPAILAALLKQAGAVKVGVWLDDGIGRISLPVPRPSFVTGTPQFFSLVLIPEETK